MYVNIHDITLHYIDTLDKKTPDEVVPTPKRPSPKGPNLKRKYKPTKPFSSLRTPIPLVSSPPYPSPPKK